MWIIDKNKNMNKFFAVVPKEEASIDRVFLLKPEVKIPDEIYRKILYWMDKAGSTEVSGLGKLKVEDGVYTVLSAFLCEQINTGATTDLDPDSVSKAMFKHKDEPGFLNWWWHSHVNMNVFWSGTDDATMARFGESGWVLATVFNKRKEMKSAYYQKGNNHHPTIFRDDIPTEIMAQKTCPEEWTKEYDENIKERPKIDYNTYNRGNYKNSYQNYGDEDIYSGRYYNRQPIGTIWGRKADGTHGWIKPEEKKNITAEKYREGTYETQKDGSIIWVPKKNKNPNYRDEQSDEGILDYLDDLADNQEEAPDTLNEELKIMGLTKYK